jgi:uncharacterized RDD family membrane protein YckC
MTALPPSASLIRRLACLVYDALLLAAIWFIAGFLVVGLMPAAPHGLARWLFQVYLLAVAGLYFTWFWRRGGQTPAMRAWDIRLLDAQGGAIGARQALIRYAVAVAGLTCAGIGLAWALIDRQGRFLHDRVAGTYLARSAALGEPQTNRGENTKDQQR